ncbi:hypothetical protein V500_08766 [Pseudogymnoascus sp. VKM F-4518 (FW-2643)]|nr:hypothetical protein V500_08766 [Pseudogymnoascus sp. VKM F-4518 (FW-2643)]
MAGKRKHGRKRKSAVQEADEPQPEQEQAQTIETPDPWRALVALRKVNPSFEIGGSVFNTAKSLYSLIAATTQDDVHTQAVLVAERPGASIPAAPERIAEAVDALGGQTSVQVENLKAMVGITSGGLCKAIRECTPLVRFFVLCAGCKTILLDTECSTLMFEMLKTSNVLSSLPCSPAQIGRLIGQISAQADSIAPSDMMHEVASAVDEFNPGPGIFERMDFKPLAELFMKLFEQVSNEAVDTILLRGHKNSVWLASTLLWLLGDDASLMIGRTHIWGEEDAKLCIQILPDSDLPWSMQVFTLTGNPTKLIFDISSDGRDSIGRIPLRMMRSFLDQYYWFPFDPNTRRSASIVTAIVAQTLILAIIQRGKVYLHCNGCKGKSHCNEALLTTIAHAGWLANVERAVFNYGWEDHEEVKFDGILLGNILRAVDGFVQGLDGLSGDTLVAEDLMEGPCKDFIRSYFPVEDVGLDRILEPALFIAADAVITCTAFLENGFRYIRPLDTESLKLADQTVRGQIRKDDVSYNSIREATFERMAGNGPRLPAINSFQDLVYPEVGDHHLFKERGYVFETTVSINGSRIEIKHYMAFADSLSKASKRRKSTWINAIATLATASHLDLESQLTAELMAQLQSRLTKQWISKGICWADPFSSPDIGFEVRTLVRTMGVQKVKIFGAGNYNAYRRSCCRIFIRHKSPLVQCIERAESNGMAAKRERTIFGKTF